MWRNVTLYGCRLERVDLSGARLTGLTVERCEFIGCRMTGVQLADTTLKNAVFEDCRFDYANLNEVRAAGPVTWIRCALTNAALTHCRLMTAAITECRTTGLELNDCDLRGADLRGNDLSTIAGLPSLRGATIDAEQLTGLAALAVKDLDLAVLDR